MVWWKQAMDASIRCFNPAADMKLPRRRSLRARMENQISIWFSHKVCLGLKWKTMR
jgi:hypothetical protein